VLLTDTLTSNGRPRIDSLPRRLLRPTLRRPSPTQADTPDQCGIGPAARDPALARALGLVGAVTDLPVTKRMVEAGTGQV
jgi:hypothetical protein